jgi:hypothetical protein
MGRDHLGGQMAILVVGQERIEVNGGIWCLEFQIGFPNDLISFLSLGLVQHERV